MPLLIVVAHPDDEVLGCGAMASVLTGRGASVTACILSGDADARTRRPDVGKLRADTAAASAELGLQQPIIGKFPNLALNVVPHHELVKFIEEAIIGTGATHIVTHHAGDLNDDHLQTSRACRAAARLSQRRDGVPKLISLRYMEVLSSTDWAYPADNSAFRPDNFFEIGAEGVSRKIRALRRYEGVMREYPHPRSEESIRALAVYRGAQSGLDHAESFQTAFFAPDSSVFV